MKKYFITIAIVALVAFGLSAFAQEKTPPSAKPDRPAAQGPLGRVKEDLQLTPEQEAKIKEFAKTRQEENKVFNEQMKKMRTDMQALRNDPKADPNKVNGQIDQMFKLQADRAKAQFKNRKDMEKIFTPEQLQKMRNRGAMVMGGGRMGGFMGRGQMGGFMSGRMGGSGGMGFGRGMMMRGPLMRLGMRMRMMMQRFMPRGGMSGFGPMGRHFGPGMGPMMRRPGGLRGHAPLKDKAPEAKPEVKK
jgi:Spy/CpxP family protein refolding chaperone